MPVRVALDDAWGESLAWLMYGMVVRPLVVKHVDEAHDARVQRDESVAQHV